MRMWSGHRRSLCGQAHLAARGRAPRSAGRPYPSACRADADLLTLGEADLNTRSVGYEPNQFPSEAMRLRDRDGHTQRIIERVAQHAVPGLADFCLIFLFED